VSQKALRRLIALEVILLFALSVYAIVSGVIELNRPSNCHPGTGYYLCLDLRGLALDLALALLVPAFLLALWSWWLLRKPRHLALLVPIFLNFIALGLTLSAVTSGQSSDFDPKYGVDAVISWGFVVVPAIIVFAGVKSFLAVSSALRAPESPMV
jgi:hypothetical protein